MVILAFLVLLQPVGEPEKTAEEALRALERQQVKAKAEQSKGLSVIEELIKRPPRKCKEQTCPVCLVVKGEKLSLRVRNSLVGEDDTPIAEIDILKKGPRSYSVLQVAPLTLPTPVKEPPTQEIKPPQRGYPVWAIVFAAASGVVAGGFLVFTTKR